MVGRMSKVGLAVTACCVAAMALASSVGAAPSSLRPSSGSVSAALVAWAHFPIQVSPRLLVLVKDDAVNAPAFGFPNDASAIAYQDGMVTAPSRFPTGPRSAAGFPLVSPQSAFNALKAAATPGPPAAAPLGVTSVTLGSGVFATDRGRRTLPAWLFAFHGIENPAQVLAVSPRRIFAPPRRMLVQAPELENSPTVGSATLAPNHRTLTVRFAGAPEGTGPCEATYSLDLGVSRTAVAVVVHVATYDRGDAGFLLPASFNQSTTTLATPLGNRVVVDTGSVTAVPVQSR